MNIIYANPISTLSFNNPGNNKKRNPWSGQQLGFSESFSKKCFLFSSYFLDQSSCFLNTDIFLKKTHK